MRRIAIVIFVLVFGLTSCVCQRNKTKGPDQPKSVDAPTKTQVDVVIHGLVGLVPTKSGCTTVFVSPQDKTMEHVPILSLETGSLGDQNKSVPDVVAPGYEGNGLALWHFTKISVDPSDVADKTLGLDETPLGSTETNLAKMRWIPHTDEIFGTHVEFDTSSLPEKVAIGDWPPGQLSPIFDPDPDAPNDPYAHKDQKWSICKRDQGMADGFRLRLNLAGFKTMLNLHVTRNGMPEEIIPVKGGSTVMLSNFPRDVPKAKDDMKHFVHLYVLIKDQGLPPCIPTRDVVKPPAARPARCVPMMFEDQE